MNNTPLQHDLSANETKVSFDLLVRTAQIACGHAKIACERDLGSIQNSTVTVNERVGHRDLAYAANRLANHAADLAIAANMLHVLTESKSRDVFTIIGKPAVTE
jgi:hypothetical protein